MFLRNVMFKSGILRFTTKRVTRRYMARDVSSLLIAAEQAPDFLQRKAIKYLGEIGNLRAYQRLVEMLKRGSAHPEILYVAILTIVHDKQLWLSEAEKRFLYSREYLLDELVVPDEKLPPPKPRRIEPIKFEKPGLRLMRDLQRSRRG